MNKAFLSVGTNKGIRQNNLKNVISYLLKNKIKIIKQSSVYKTEPLEYKKQRKFYNIVIEIEFSYSCTELFLILKNIENLMGRNFYNPRNYPRIIDIDILTYNNKTINNDMYNIPHPRLHKRKFVLIPWNEISSNYIVPKYNKDISSLLNSSKDLSIICKLDN